MNQSVIEFKDVHVGERCFILGNGPSLTEAQLEIIKDEDTFGTNRIYLKDYVPTYYVCVNNLVLEQFWGEIATLDTFKFIADKVEDKKMWDEVDPCDTYWLDTSLNFPSFSSPTGPIWEGYTVTYVALQLAYFMGYKTVVLLGVDHDYGRFNQMFPDMEIVSTGPDDAHHDPEYFGKGTRWHTPNLLMSELAYTFAKQAYEADGRRIINCSGRTKLEVFETLPLNHYMGWSQPRVSAIVSAYYSEKYFAECLTDLARQTLYNAGSGDKDLEIVIVCQEGSFEDEHIKGLFPNLVSMSALTVIRTTDIPTVYAAWNLGVEAARGKYLTNANTDDRHHEKAYEIMANVLDAKRKIDLVYHDSFITWDENQTFQEFLDAEHQWEDLATYVEEDTPGIWKWPEYSRGELGGGCFMGPQPMWRANLHQRYGPFLDNFVSAGDYEFWLRVSKADNMYHIPYVLGLYLARLDSVENTNTTKGQVEAHDAIALHQADTLTIDPLGEDMLFLKTPYTWTFIKKKDFVEQLQEM